MGYPWFLIGDDDDRVMEAGARQRGMVMRVHERVFDVSSLETGPYVSEKVVSEGLYRRQANGGT